MKKHVVSFILACLLIVSMCPVSVFAAGKTTEGQVTYFDDGSYLTVTMVVIYDNTWSLDSKSCSKSGNTATGNITMAKKLLLGSGKVPITLTLSCDKNGNLS